MEPRNHLFTIWLTDKDWDAMPFLWEICIASAQVQNRKPITIYTNHKLHLSFLDRQLTHIEILPDEVLENAEKLTSNKAHQSDFIRLWLLSVKGGIYFDTDILFWSSFDNIWNELQQSGKSILYPREDKNMICNCMIMCNNTEKAYPFFKDMFNEYDERFINHSYLHNSQKMMNLMSRRYYKDILIYDKPSLFSIPWNITEDIEDVFTADIEGIGQHLYSSNEDWRPFRHILDNHCYDLDPYTFPTILTRDVIDKYIDLMKEEEDK